MATRRQLMGLAGATIDTNGNLVAYSGPLQDLFVNPAGGDFRIKDASVPSGIGAFGSAGSVVTTPTQTSPPVKSGPSIGVIAALAVGAFFLLGD